MASIFWGDRTFAGVRAVIFDKDGTLADSHHYLRQQAAKRLARLEAHLLGSPYGDRLFPTWTMRLAAAWGVTETAVHPAGLLAVGSRQENEWVSAGYITPLGYSWIEALTLVQTAFAEASATTDRKDLLTPAFPGIVELLRSLHGAGYRLGILSADITPNVEAFAQTHGLAPYLHLCMGTQPGLPKPDPGLLELACQQLGVTAPATIVVGDSSADIELAKRGGAAAAIAATWGWSTAFTLPNADVHLASVDEIRIAEAIHCS
ncbi:MAG: HAD family hydrolase [Synechococcales bacterium]|nr:HAD family hydrolase [Synechococcales bacterium]